MPYWIANGGEVEGWMGGERDPEAGLAGHCVSCQVTQ